MDEQDDRGRVLKSNLDDPALNHRPEALRGDDADASTAGERMAATDGEPAISEVPSITQQLINEGALPHLHHEDGTPCAGCSDEGPPPRS